MPWTQRPSAQESHARITAHRSCPRVAVSGSPQTAAVNSGRCDPLLWIESPSLPAATLIAEVDYRPVGHQRLWELTEEEFCSAAAELLG